MESVSMRISIGKLRRVIEEARGRDPFQGWVPGMINFNLEPPMPMDPRKINPSQLSKVWAYKPVFDSTDDDFEREKWTYKSITKGAAAAQFERQLRDENAGARAVGMRVKESEVIELKPVEWVDMDTGMVYKSWSKLIAAREMGASDKNRVEAMSESRLRRLVRELLSESTGSDLIDRGVVVELSSPVSLVHRSDNPDLRVSGFAPLAQRASKQSTRSDDYQVGLYAYESKHDVPRYGENKIEFTLPVGTRVLDLTVAGRGTTSRIPVSQARKLLDAGVKAVKGYDYIGPPEWVVLAMP
jgi:hypothetical protein